MRFAQTRFQKVNETALLAALLKSIPREASSRSRIFLFSLVNMLVSGSVSTGPFGHNGKRGSLGNDVEKKLFLNSILSTITVKSKMKW